MRTYLITYLLDDSSTTYSKISSCIKKYPNWAKVFARTWLITSKDRPSEIRDNLSSSIDGEGKILVIEITSSAWASYSIDKTITSWIKENL